MLKEDEREVLAECQAQHSLMQMINIVARTAEGLFERSPGCTVTFRQFVVLRVIANRPGCNLAYVSDQTRVDRTTLTYVTDTLRRRGLIKKRRSRNDERFVNLHILEPGKKILYEMTPVMTEIERTMHAATETNLASAMFAILKEIDAR